MSEENEIKDNRELMKNRPREVCRVCSSPDVHVDHYGAPTTKCIGYLRDEYNNTTADLREKLRIAEEALRHSRSRLFQIYNGDWIHDEERFTTIAAFAGGAVDEIDKALAAIA